MSSNTILVFSEKQALVKELLGKARQAADSLSWSVAALAFGNENIQLGEIGADSVYTVEAEVLNPEIAADSLAAAVRQVEPAVVLVGATKLGMETAPRVAERLGAGYAAWVVDFDIDNASHTLTAHCMLYTGTGLATYQFKPGMAILTAAPGVFEGKATAGKSASIVPLQVPASSPRLTILEYKPKPASGSSVEEAMLVVDVGQGVKQREDLQMLQELADILDGQMACSRPIASDRDWFPDWLGLSGAKIKPELCLTVGISGAIQHIVGIRDSRVIAAVNTDEGAAIFAQADYGVVADLYEFIPALIERLKARGIQPAWKA